MDKEILNLLDIGAISVCHAVSDQYISSFFLADKPNGKKRFILNLKYLNVNIVILHFKMEDFRTVSRLLQSGCYAASTDLKNAYYLVPVHKQHRKYLRFYVYKHIIIHSRLNNLYKF